MFALPVAAVAQPPGYYNTANGLNSAALKTALHDIIDNHTVLSYPLWSHFDETDAKPNGNVWDIYSDVPNGTPPYTYSFVSDQRGNYNGEGDCFNHEHSWPQSYFNSTGPAQSDLFHIYPTDGEGNAQHGNLPYGEVNNPSWTSDAGSKKGPIAVPNAPAGTAFEPIDAYKGDIARSYFYMATRYLGEDAGWSNWDMANGANLKAWAITMLMQWHLDDPVSNKEIDRNEAIYDVQGNRNPYIDHPEYVACIWGTANCVGTSIAAIAEAHGFKLSPNPAKAVVAVTCNDCQISVLDITGKTIMKQDAPASTHTLNVSGWNSGIYMVRMADEKGIAIQKLIVE